LFGNPKYSGTFKGRSDFDGCEESDGCADALGISVEAVGYEEGDDIGEGVLKLDCK
jgi:hypothetical protein